MGTRIEAAATSHRRPWRRSGALKLSDHAATACLRRANHGADDLDLLINAGMYKDRGAAEPALASIIQEDIGANPGSPPRIGHHGTFSFDVVDGACGVMQSAQLVDAFVGSGSARLAMIVAADADPSPLTSRNFRFPPVGGAVVISHTSGDAGFHDFRIRTFPQYASLFESRLYWDPSGGIARRGRNVLEIVEAPDYCAQLVECTEEVVRELITGIEIDLLIASQYPRDFAGRLAHRLGLPAESVPHVPRELVGSYTAGPIAALEAAIESGQLARANHALFVTAGAGITVAAALYRS